MPWLKTLQQFYVDHIDPDGIQPFQAVRTVVAAVLAILFYHSLSWPQAYWVLFSTVLILQTYNAAAPKQKWFSLLMTGASAVILTFIASIIGKYILIIGVFFAITTFISVYLNVISSNTANAAFFVNLFCLYAGSVSVSWNDTVERTICVLAGFLISVMVCACLWPERLPDTIRLIIAQNLSRLSELSRTLSERYHDTKAIAVRRNRFIRGLQRARQTIPSEEIQSWQMIHQIEYLYEIILSLHEIKKLLEAHHILILIHKELSILLRRLNWLLRQFSLHIQHTNTPAPRISKFIYLLRTFEKHYNNHFKSFNNDQILKFIIYMDNIQKLERYVNNLAELSKRMEYLS